MEQITKADLPAVTLFENRGYLTNQKGVPAGAGSLAPPFHGDISFKFQIPKTLKFHLIVIQSGMFLLESKMDTIN